MRAWLPQKLTAFNVYIGKEGISEISHVTREESTI